MTEIIDPKYIRVSSILSMIPTMTDGKWGYPIQNIDQGVLQRKSELGTSVHAAINAHVKGEFIPMTEKEEGYFESYLKWEKALNVQPVATEKRFYSEPMKMTGCIDMLASFGQDDNCYLIDFKCTVAPDPVKWPIQGALYHLLTRVDLIDIEKTVLFVQLDKDGELPKVHKYTITDSLLASAMAWYNAYIYLTNK